MIKQDQELLLRDLCARLPYNAIVDYSYNVFDVYNGNHVFHNSKCILTCSLLDVFISPRQNEKGEYIKPYLFPLSSMTEEQEKEFDQLIELELKAINNEIDHTHATAFEADFYNKYHFDWRGLIEKGLAIDATGLNIY